MNEGGDVRNGSRMVDMMRRAELQGATGPISMDSHADRQANIWMLDMDSSGVFQNIVGIERKSHGQSRYRHYNNDFRWPNGRTGPRNAPGDYSSASNNNRWNNNNNNWGNNNNNNNNRWNNNNMNNDRWNNNNNWNNNNDRWNNNRNNNNNDRWQNQNRNSGSGSGNWQNDKWGNNNQNDKWNSNSNSGG